MFATQEKWARRMRARNDKYKIRQRIPVRMAGLGCPRRLLATAMAKLATISTNSRARNVANRTGEGNKRARFLVQPSRSCAKLRYMRVRTASAPWRENIFLAE